MSRYAFYTILALSLVSVSFGTAHARQSPSGQDVAAKSQVISVPNDTENYAYSFGATQAGSFVVKKPLGASQGSGSRKTRGR